MLELKQVLPVPSLSVVFRIECSCTFRAYTMAYFHILMTRGISFGVPPVAVVAAYPLTCSAHDQKLP
ncbi:MAG TPA: hypothetical protein DCP92_19255 [Nitrospiraceae bacterium]|nr:hypothetical protein [Nitrospiraceae bacterium]